MAYDASIRVDTRVDASGMNQGVKAVEAGLNKLTSSLGKLAGAVGIGFSVKALLDFSSECMEISSDLTEVQNVVDTAFGSMAQDVEVWASTSIQQFGMSELSAKQTASTYMAMATAMGTAQQDAAEMSMSLAGLSADVASFYNIDQETAAYKLRSVFTGETEALKDLGIVMTQANLESYSLANGFSKTYSEMSSSEQLAVRYAYVMDALSLAQGDFAKTSDSWANQTRIFNEQLSTLKGLVGDVLIQSLLPILQQVNDALSWLTEKATEARNALYELFGWELPADTPSVDTSGVDCLTDSYGDLTDAADSAADAIKDASDAADGGSGSGSGSGVQRDVLGFDQITKLSDQSGSSGGGSGGSGGGADGTTEDDAASALTSQESPLTTAAQKLSDAVDDLGTHIDGLGTRARNAIQPIADLFRDRTATITLKLKKAAGFDDLKKEWDSLNSGTVEKWLNALLEAQVQIIVEQIVTEMQHQTQPTVRQPVTQQSQPTSPSGGGIRKTTNGYETYGTRDGYEVYTPKSSNQRTTSNGFGGNSGGIRSTKQSTSILDTVKKWWDSLKQGSATKTLDLRGGSFGGGSGGFSEGVRQWESIQDGKATKTLNGKTTSAYLRYAKDFLNLKTGTITKTMTGEQTALYKSCQRDWSSWGDGTITKTVSGSKASAYASVKNDWTSWRSDSITKTIQAAKTSAYSSIKGDWSGWKSGSITKTASASKASAYSSIKSDWSGWKSGSVTKTVQGARTSSFSTVKKDWDSIKDKKVNATMALTATVSNMKSWINSKIISPLNTAIHVVLPKVSIPKLARGGVVNQATLAMVGEAGREAVMPLEHNTGWIGELAGQIAQQMGTTSGEFVVEVHVGSELLTRQVVQSINDTTRRTGRCPIYI